MTPTEERLHDLATHGSPPTHDWQPVALAVLDLLRDVRKATGWDTCSMCGAWAEGRDDDGRGLECCSVICAGCGDPILDKLAEEADRDGDGRPICDQCAIDRDHANEARRGAPAAWRARL